MSKQIYVQAQPDHIESLFKSSAHSALEELIWNALDADAKEVKVDLVTNALGAVDAVRITDDGTGIDILNADSTFGSLGGSWKRDSKKTTLLTGRRLHGRHGRGRFKAFALGAHVEWRTSADIAGQRLQYLISGDIANPGVFDLESLKPSEAPQRGTEVVISNSRAVCDSLLNAAETVQTLASKFALYLKSYPDVRIYFNGLPVTPIIVQKRMNEFELELDNGAKAKLEIIEWKRRFAGAGKLVIAGGDGFQLHETSPKVRSGGISFTAYLISKRFSSLAEENAFMMEELNSEVRMYLDAARKKMKEYFLSIGLDRTAGLIGNWMDEGSYPYEADDTSEERERFDALSVELASRMESLNDLSTSEREILFALLKNAARAVPKGTLKELLK
ncbi:MAG: ATP-binding protein [Kiritimatiellae bacterium]|nr:ATP-binding protein [Kiritimatiellia bacterium]